MADKTGVVMEIKNKRVSLMTPSGEFIEVKINRTVPVIGSIYTGTVINKIPFYKYATIAACLLIFVSTGGVAYAYYTPTSSITLNNALKLKLNRWNKIIKALPLNEDGENLLASLDIKNKNINDGLNLIMEESKSATDQISLEITSPSDDSVDLSKFENTLKEKDLNVQINYSKNNSANSNKADIIKYDTKNGKIRKDQSPKDTINNTITPEKSNNRNGNPQVPNNPSKGKVNNPSIVDNPNKNSTEKNGLNKNFKNNSKDKENPSKQSNTKKGNNEKDTKNNSKDNNSKDNTFKKNKIQNDSNKKLKSK